MAALKSLGTTLTLNPDDDSSLIADLTSIGEIGVTSDEIDVTTLDSVSGYKEFIAGQKDSGEVSLAGYVKSEANMESMLALAEAQSLESWEVTFTSGSKWAFDGFVKSFKEAESKVDGVRGFSASIRISGATSYTAAEVSA
jgi:predicted secreted protein